jgi:hypothetical protein
MDFWPASTNSTAKPALAGEPSVGVVDSTGGPDIDHAGRWIRGDKARPVGAGLAGGNSLRPRPATFLADVPPVITCSERPTVLDTRAAVEPKAAGNSLACASHAQHGGGSSSLPGPWSGLRASRRGPDRG